MKFNLKNVELESIDLILTHEIEYKKYIDDISKNYIYNYHNDTMLDKKRKRRTGFPKFKSAKRSRKSYTTNNQKGTIAIIDCKHIKLLKIGNLTLPTAKGKGRVK